MAMDVKAFCMLSVAQSLGSTIVAQSGPQRGVKQHYWNRTGGGLFASSPRCFLRPPGQPLVGGSGSGTLV